MQLYAVTWRRFHSNYSWTERSILDRFVLYKRKLAFYMFKKYGIFVQNMTD